MITRAQLATILPHAGKRVDTYLPHLNRWMPAYEINTAARVAAFIPQIGHESGSFLYVEEIASGKAYDTGSLAKRLGNTPEADGDGQRYKGRGLIQVTGHDNYLACSLHIFGDDRLLHFPELLEDPRYAVQSACWYWKQHGLNELADVRNFKRITKLINGGQNGAAEREALYAVALAELRSVHASTSALA